MASASTDVDVEQLLEQLTLEASLAYTARIPAVLSPPAPPSRAPRAPAGSYRPFRLARPSILTELDKMKKAYERKDDCKDDCIDYYNSSSSQAGLAVTYKTVVI